MLNRSKGISNYPCISATLSWGPLRTITLTRWQWPTRWSVFKPRISLSGHPYTCLTITHHLTIISLSEKMANAFASVLRHCICLRHSEREVLEEEERREQRSCLRVSGWGVHSSSVMCSPTVWQLWAAFSRSAFQKPIKAGDIPDKGWGTVGPAMYSQFPHRMQQGRLVHWCSCSQCYNSIQ